MSLGDETARTREALKAGVAASVHDLIEEAQRLVLWTRRFFLIGAAIFAVSVSTAAFVVISQFQLRHIAQQNQRNGNAIRSCTTTDGECFKRNQEQGAVLLACANRHPTDIKAIRACVAAGLKGKP